MKHAVVVLSCGLLIAAAAMSACSESVDPPLGTSAEALTRSLTIRRGTYGTVADTTISASALNRSFGSQRQLQVSARNEALLRFDLATIPASAVIESADLTLAISGGDDEADDDGGDGDHEGHAIAPIKLKRVTAAWAESTVTYRSFAQQFAPAVAATIVLANRTSSKTVDVRALVQGWVDGTYPNYGLVLTTAGKQHTLVVSSEHATVARRPTLAIRYTLSGDDCADDPCVHGTCTNTPTSYTCACADGFTGTNCDLNIDDCALAPCQNGGACTDGDNGFTCTCADGFTGTTCGTNVDECAPGPCQNGGVCTDGVASHTCACPPGTSGTDCEIVDVCSATSNPCLNDGVCTLLPGNTYSCECPAGFSGTRCETNPDDCGLNPCSGNGTCADGVASYTCTCFGGYTGTDCETVIDHCTPDPCLNGGTCASDATGYTCTCAAGYGGSNCETDLNDCAGSPCQNGGACVDGVNSFTCECPMGHTGPTCEDVCQALTTVAADTEFPDGNWRVLSTGSPTDNMSAPFGSQITDMYETIDGLTDQQFVNERRVAYTAGTYDPAVSGPLARLEYSFAAQDRTGYPRIITFIQLLLIQGDNVYVVPGWGFASANLNSPLPVPGDWTTTAQAGLTAASFELADGGHAHPDFSASGAPITFGYRAYVTNLATPSGSRLLVKFAVDDFTVKVLPTARDCDDVDECATAVDNCAPAPAGVCTNTVGSFTCSCADGYTGDGLTCTTTTTLTLSLPAGAQRGVETQLSATLTRAGSPPVPLADALVVFTSFIGGPGDEALIGIGTTDGSGLATALFTPPLATGYQIRARYFGAAGVSGATTVGFLNVGCPAGFDGLACDHDIDECAAQPCLNGATCTDGIASYTCACVAGYTGASCETRITPVPITYEFAGTSGSAAIAGTFTYDAVAMVASADDSGPWLTPVGHVRYRQPAGGATFTFNRLPPPEPGVTEVMALDSLVVRGASSSFFDAEDFYQAEASWTLDLGGGNALVTRIRLTLYAPNGTMLASSELPDALDFVADPPNGRYGTLIWDKITVDGTGEHLTSETAGIITSLHRAAGP